MGRKKTTSTFGQVSGPSLPETSFAEHLEACFQTQTTQKVLETFQQFGLPAPERSQEFFASNLGCVLFSNRYGILIRIEHKHDQINDIPWVLPPIRSIDLGNAVVEICGGCRRGTSKMDVDFLRRELKRYGIDFFDDDVRNYGLIPVKSARFPIGIPVVIDRGAVVKKFYDDKKYVQQALQMSGAAREALEIEEKLYDPLRKAFEDAWPDPEKMKQFWELCEQYVKEKKFIAGWNTEGGADPDSKRAAKAAEAYNERLSQHLVRRSSASAAPQLPRQPV